MTKRTKIIAFLLAGTLLTSCSVQKDDVAKKENVQPETNIEKKIDEDTNKEETAKLSIEEVKRIMTEADQQVQMFWDMREQEGLEDVEYTYMDFKLLPEPYDTWGSIVNEFAKYYTSEAAGRVPYILGMSEIEEKVGMSYYYSGKILAGYDIWEIEAFPSEDKEAEYFIAKGRDSASGNEKTYLKKFVLDNGIYKMDTVPTGDSYYKADGVTLITEKIVDEFVELEYPWIVIEGKEEVQEKIQNVFKEQYKEVADGLNQEYGGEEVFDSVWTGYNVNRCSSGILSVNEFYSLYPHGAAHPMSSSKTFNFDLANGNQLKLEDVFKAEFDYLTYVNDKVKSVFEEQGFGEGFETIDGNTQFYFDDRGLVVYFQQYEYAPYAAGFPEVLFEYKDIEKKMNEDIFRKLDIKY